VTSLEGLTDKTNEHVGDIQVWLNALAYVLASSCHLTSDADTHNLDTTGLAGFSHDFDSFSGHKSDIARAFEELSDNSLGAADGLVAVLQPTFPLVSKIPTQRARAIARLKAACMVVARRFMERMGEEKGERSIMGLLSKRCSAVFIIHTLILISGTAQNATTGTPVTEVEVRTQIMTFLVAGSETTSCTPLVRLIRTHY
jgi:hypothetical protein